MAGRFTGNGPGPALMNGAHYDYIDFSIINYCEIGHARVTGAYPVVDAAPVVLYSFARLGPFGAVARRAEGPARPHL